MTTVKPRMRKTSHELTVEELERLAAGLDEPFVADQFGPMDAAARALWNKAKRQRGRPRVGEGVEVVSVSIEKGLLKRADRMARKRKISRARLIAEGLERVLAKAERTRATGRTAKKTRRRAA